LRELFHGQWSLLLPRVMAREGVKVKCGRPTRLFFIGKRRYKDA